MDGYEEIEKRLKKEVEESVPDVLDSILEKANRKTQPQNNNIVEFKKPAKRKSAVRVLSSAAAVFIVILIVAVIRQSQDATFDVEIDVNPGVVLEVNTREKVTDVVTLNDDGKKVLDGMDLKGANLDVAINALMFSIIKNGYINEMTNSVLVTLTDEGGVSGKNFVSEISKRITDSLKESSIEGSVLVQSADKTDELVSLSEQYGITVGKASLIKHLIDSEKTAFTFSQLAALSVNELNVLMSEQSIDNGVTVTGSASRKAYIGEAAAESIAYAAANVKKEQVTKTECKLDLDDGVLAYEVEFEAGGSEYECDINALTGEVLSCKSEKEDENEAGEPEITVPDTIVFKTKEEIKDSILKKNGFTASDCRNFEIELDYEDGIAKYEVEFICGETEYDYEVNAVSGKILSYSFKNIPTQPAVAERTSAETSSEETTAVTSSAPASTIAVPTSADETKASEAKQTMIGEKKAKSIALEHAGLSDKKVKVWVKPEIDDDTRQKIYQVEIEYGEYEYEYEIDAYTGDILDFEKEKDD